MGNSNQGSEYGTVILHTENPYYLAGEKVAGSVYLNIAKEGFPGSAIFLVIKAKEECKWEKAI